MSLADISKKYFKCIDDNKGFGVAYTNDTANKINKTMHNENIIKNKIKATHLEFPVYEGLFIRARKYYKISKDIKIHTNFTYKIIKINDKTITINEPLNNINIDIFKPMLKSFSLTLAGTGHSTQGLTINGEITVHNVNHFCMSREWYYTAITRATKLDNVYINLGKVYNGSQLTNHINAKIKNHMEEDNKKKRSFNVEDYVTSSWVIEHMIQTNSVCFRCNEVYDVEYEGYNVKGFSINRIDNSKAHLQNNCNVICLHCNVKNH